MKIFVVNILLVLFSTHLKSTAQQTAPQLAPHPVTTQHANSNAPRLLDKYPAELHIKASEILSLFTSKENDNVKVHSADGSLFEGHISQNKKFNEDAQTVGVELKGFPEGTRLVINRINRDGKIIYRATIFNHQHPDAYTLKSFDGNEFVFVKTDREKIVTE
jgi:hypothetical protein